MPDCEVKAAIDAGSKHPGAELLGAVGGAVGAIPRFASGALCGLPVGRVPGYYALAARAHGVCLAVWAGRAWNTVGPFVLYAARQL